MRVVELSPEFLDDAARVHLEAFRGYMNAQMGMGYAKAFLQWFARAPMGIALVAVVDGRVAGYVVGAPIGYDRAMTQALMGVVARAILLRPWLLFQLRFFKRLALRTRKHFAPRTEDIVETGAVMSLVGIGVSRGGQGHGVGRVLMEEFERCARQYGMTAMRLSVYADNERARRLYQGSGWAVEREEGTAIYYRRTL